MRYLCLILSCFSVLAMADDRVQVLGFDAPKREVTVTFSPKMRWVPEDNVCVFTENNTSACGKITAATKDVLKIHMNENDFQWNRGSYVFLRRLSRPLASVNSSELIEQGQEKKTHDIAIGIATGFNYFFPTLHLQQAIDRSFSVGVMPLYVNYTVDGASVKAAGGFVTGSYYYTHAPFRGFYGQVGAGFYSIDAAVGSASESHTQGAFQGTMNWRGRASWELGLDIGVSAGLQYVIPVQRSLTNNFSGFLPLFMVSLGYPF